MLDFINQLKRYRTYLSALAKTLTSISDCACSTPLFYYWIFYSLRWIFVVLWIFLLFFCVWLISFQRINRSKWTRKSIGLINVLSIAHAVSSTYRVECWKCEKNNKSNIEKLPSYHDVVCTVSKTAKSMVVHPNTSCVYPSRIESLRIQADTSTPLAKVLRPTFVRPRAHPHEICAHSECAYATDVRKHNATDNVAVAAVGAMAARIFRCLH